jgi:UDP-glucose 4,6-dehydratase
MVVRGSHVVRLLVERYPQYRVINLDSLEYCAGPAFLEDLAGRPNYTFVRGSILGADMVRYVMAREGVDTVLHFAAETHVDNSFGNSLHFTSTNVLGTHTLLECARAAHVRRFVLISTDEVRGDISVLESADRMAPTNPYAATKAAAELLARSYAISFGLPVIITRSNNAYGPNQFPEKIVPKFICMLLRGETTLPIHGSGENRRSYLYVEDVARAFECVLHRGRIGEVYNIASADELTNLQVAHAVSSAVLPGAESARSAVVRHVADRPFNDARYNIDGAALHGLGWTPSVSFPEGLRRTVEWYRAVDLRTHWVGSVDHALQQ